MRISDWSSDVCSSDLAVRFFRRRRNAGDNKLDPMTAFGIDNEHLPVQVEKRVEVRIAILAHGFSLSDCDKKDKPRSEERRVGKSVSVRVDLGGGRSLKKKKKTYNKQKRKNQKH